MTRMRISLLLATLLATSVAPVAFAQQPKPDWNKWWPQFQAAVAKHDAEAVADMTFFPTQWELGKIHRVGSKAVFIQKFDTYFPAHMRDAVATRKPEGFPDGSYIVSWTYNKLDYTLDFTLDGQGGYRLNSLEQNSNY